MESEKKEFLTTQLITYIGNKRLLLTQIEKEIKIILQKLQKQKVVCLDLFSGSGVVARLIKQYSSELIVNDLEYYSKVINTCYLTNKIDYPQKICDVLRKEILAKSKVSKIEGIVAKYYAPKDTENIIAGERVFYTRENALLIDTYRSLIDELVDEKLKQFFLAPLITEASIHVNTSGVFKGFYKNKKTGIGCFGGVDRNALSRIMGCIDLKSPVLSNFNSEVQIHSSDAVLLSEKLKSIDIAYLDPPYNQHPYGSNYFMLNLILKNKIDTIISPVSGITQDWNRSNFNKRHLALSSLEKVVSNLDSKYIILSYNSEGFIAFNDMTNMLSKYGHLESIKIKYNTFRGSRNLANRNIHVNEYLFVLEKVN